MTVQKMCSSIKNGEQLEIINIPLHNNKLYFWLLLPLFTPLNHVNKIEIKMNIFVLLLAEFSRMLTSVSVFKPRTLLVSAFYV